MERIGVIKIAIDKFRGGDARDMANWIDMALDLYDYSPSGAVEQQAHMSDNMAWYKQRVSSGLVGQLGVAQNQQGLIPGALMRDPGYLGKAQNVPQGMYQQAISGLAGSPVPLSGATVLGAEDAMSENEETLDDVHARMVANLPPTIEITPDGRQPMACEVIITKNESSVAGGRQPCVGVRFQWDTGDSKEVVCDNFLFPGKVQTAESVLSEMVNRVKSLYKRRTTPIVAKAPALDKTPVNAGNA